jgi:site-specific DNA-methyltransferase (adenine-specific)
MEVLKTFPLNCIDTIITDPPYALGFMGKEWDTFDKSQFGRKGEEGKEDLKVKKSFNILPRYGNWRGYYEFSLKWATEALRVAKPGATLLCFGGTRTFHRLACAIEDAGWIIKDCLMYLYGSGFPKATDISKQLDKIDAVKMRRQRDLRFTEWMRATGITSKKINEVTNSNMGSHYLTDREQPAIATGEMFNLIRPYLPEVPEYIEEMVRERTIESKTFKEREVIGKHPNPAGSKGNTFPLAQECNLTIPATPEAKLWKGWKSHGLKPAWEPIIVAMKPNKGSYAENALKYGVSGLNIEGGRIGFEKDINLKEWKTERKTDGGSGWGFRGNKSPSPQPQGRFPANLILSCECDEVVEGEVRGDKRGITFDKKASSIYGSKSISTKAEIKNPNGKENVIIHTNPECPCYMLDEQSGELKSGERKRTEDNKNSIFGFGGGKSIKNSGGASRFFYCAKSSRSERNMGEINCSHPTVKPLRLMEYLCILTKTPTGGVVLDPFLGSGTTAMAAKKTGRDFIGIEKEEEYCKIAEARIKATTVQYRLF